MTENEFLLEDRLQKIRQIIGEYGEENFYLSFSGGKDSTVLSALLDMALPDNKIPRVYANTGIDLNMVRDFVYEMAKTDDRIVIVKPKVPIKKMLEEDGYPFKSKYHSFMVDVYQRHGEKLDGIKNYLEEGEKSVYRPCPKKLRYQFSEDFQLRVSDKCCKRLKEEPLKDWEKENNKKYAIIGIMRQEGGRRGIAQCLVFERKGQGFKAFQPLVPITSEFEDWLIETYNIKICDIYNPPYNFERTGCKGCPFAVNLQKELDVLEEYFPEERKQCEIIWKPVYDEYRRIGYRLKKEVV